jgi:SulP family sulfate permease
MKPKLLTSLHGYNVTLFRGDVLAGITVALVAIPLSLAIAIASGARPETGLVTAAVAGFLISMLGGSSIQIGGPTGAFIVVVYGVINAHGFDGLLLATAMAGVILLVAGFLGLGSLIRYVPAAVIHGFTLGIALIIASSQIKDFLGLRLKSVPADFIHKGSVIFDALPSTNITALSVGVATIFLISGFRRYFPRFPGLIAVLILASLVSWYLGFEIETLGTQFGTLDFDTIKFGFPHISYALVAEMLPSSIVIAFLAGIESLLSAVVSDRMTGDQHRPNAEIVAQGVANIGSSLFGGLPATGAIARTATNFRAGGKTPVAGMVHAITVLAISFFAAPLACHLLMPAMAALLIHIAWNMSDPGNWLAFLKEGKLGERFLLWITFGLTVLVDLTVAIGVGVGLGLLLQLKENGLSTFETKARRK